MKCFFVLVATFSIALSASLGVYEEIKNYKNDIFNDGYEFSYQSSTSQRQEKGTIKGNDTEVVGSYSFQTPDGITYNVDYTSGIKGYIAKISRASAGNSFYTRNSNLTPSFDTTQNKSAVAFGYASEAGISTGALASLAG